jgi:hypothetical protein
MAEVGLSSTDAPSADLITELSPDSVTLPLATLAKTNFIVDLDNINQGTTPLMDPIRRDYNAYWEDPNRRGGRPDNAPDIVWRRNSLENVNNANIQEIQFDSTVTGSPGRRVDNQFGSTSQTIRLYPNPANFESFSSWVAYADIFYNTPFGTKYYDHATIYTTPFTPRDMLLVPNADGVNTASTKFSYNFYLEKYENIIQDLDITERIYPNLYTFYIEKDRGAEAALSLDEEGPPRWGGARMEEGTSADIDRLSPTAISEDYDLNSIYHDFVTLNRNMRNVFVNSLRPRRNESGLIETREKVGEKDRGEYFDVWSHIYPFASGSPDAASLEEITSRYSNVIVSSAALELAQVEYNSYKELFPMYCEVEYTPSSPRNVSTTMINTRIMNNLMKHVCQDFASLPYSEAPEKYSVRRRFAHKYVTVGSDRSFVKGVLWEPSYKVFEFAKWIYDAWIDDGLFQDLSDIGSKEQWDAPLVFLRSFRSGLGGGMPIDKPSEALEALEDLQVKMEEMVANYSRTYEQILRGVPAYSEDLFFKLVKYRVNNGQREEKPLQTFYLPNKGPGSEGAVLNFIDTQVKYNQQYEYDMFTCRFVVGSEVNFTNLYIPPAEAGDAFEEDRGPFGSSSENPSAAAGVPMTNNGGWSPSGNSSSPSTGPSAGPSAGPPPAGSPPPTTSSTYNERGCPRVSDDPTGAIQCLEEIVNCEDIRGGTWIGGPEQAGYCQEPPVTSSEPETGDDDDDLDDFGFGASDAAGGAGTDGTDSLDEDCPLGSYWDVFLQACMPFDTTGGYGEEFEISACQDACPEGYTWVSDVEFPTSCDQGSCVEDYVAPDATEEAITEEDMYDAMGYHYPSNCPEDDYECIMDYMACVNVGNTWNTEHLFCEGLADVGGISEDVEDPKPDPPCDYCISITAQVSPSIKVIELPYLAGPLTDYSFQRGTILDDPGMPPEVDFIPYRGINNKILLNLQGGIGERYWTPIVFSAREQEYVDRIREMNPNTDDPTILYENDDPSVEFEIYRMDTKPRSYKEVSRIPGGPTRVATQSKLTGNRKLPSTSFVDEIESNKKYYYILRSLDIHGHASYPTEIYEVELVDNEGAVYPEVRSYPLPATTQPTPLKKMRRFIQVRLQSAQLIFNAAAAAAGLTAAEKQTVPSEENLPLGVRDKSVWGRKFKIRLTSSKTGKKIDLNLNFKKSYNATRTIPVEIASDEGTSESSPPSDDGSGSPYS